MAITMALLSSSHINLFSGKTFLRFAFVTEAGVLQLLRKASIQTKPQGILYGEKSMLVRKVNLSHGIEREYFTALPVTDN